MAFHADPLRNLKVAAPCSADWNAMAGNDRVRFCGQCQLNVYNLSGMTRPEAENLIRQREGRLCVRFYRRADGTVLTRDCPTGLRAVRRRVTRWTAAAFSAVLSFFSGVGLTTAWQRKTEPMHVMGTIAVQPQSERGAQGEIATPVNTKEPVHMMGALALPERRRVKR